MSVEAYVLVARNDYGYDELSCKATLKVVNQLTKDTLLDFIEEEVYYSYFSNRDEIESEGYEDVQDFLDLSNTEKTVCDFGSESGSRDEPASVKVSYYKYDDYLKKVEEDYKNSVFQLEGLLADAV